MIRTRNYPLTKAKANMNKENRACYRQLQNEVIYSLPWAKLALFEKICVQSSKNVKKIWSELHMKLAF
jgi:hypothetical protein